MSAQEILKRIKVRHFEEFSTNVVGHFCFLPKHCSSCILSTTNHRKRNDAIGNTTEDVYFTCQKQLYPMRGKRKLCIKTPRCTFEKSIVKYMLKIHSQTSAFKTHFLADQTGHYEVLNFFEKHFKKTKLTFQFSRKKKKRQKFLPKQA